MTPVDLSPRHKGENAFNLPLQAHSLFPCCITRMFSQGPEQRPKFLFSKPTHSPECQNPSFADPFLGNYLRVGVRMTHGNRVNTCAPLNMAGRRSRIRSVKKRSDIIEKDTNRRKKARNHLCPTNSPSES